MAISHIPRSVGHNFAPEYQISAVPYNKTSADTTSIVVVDATGVVVDGADPANPGNNNTTIKKIDFPKITQWLQFKSTGAIKVFFSRKDVVANNNNCINLSAGETTYPLSLRCTSLYFVSNAVTNLQIRAGLTSIDSSEFTEVVETFLGDNQ